ncbi:LysR family transcriptional regulator [Hydrogenophaga sp. UC242_50]|uniref:helix-turn-helix domain-containing protein n=1 Tax=Hydrogenophaga sp. UC242_50 TaxID=3350169 RepID=UPI0036D223B2
MDTTTHIRTFVEVVRCGGFSEAARQLGVVPSVVANASPSWRPNCRPGCSSAPRAR